MTEGRLFALAPPGLEAVVEDEVRELGGSGVAKVEGGVEFDGGLDAGMKACLWLRAATSVRLRLGEFDARSAGQLQDGLRRIDLSAVANRETPLELKSTARKSRIHHTGRIDACVETAFTGIAFKHGSGGLHLRIHHDRVTVSVDLAGERLQRRGWRKESGPAPLRETLAAGLLALCGWRGEQALVDPMCGSGSIPIEGALMATRTPPGLLREFAFERFPGFDPARWAALLEEARTMQRAAPGPLRGSDVHRGAVASAGRNATRAHMENDIVFERLDVGALTSPAPEGLLLVNPPYGGRIGARGATLSELHRTFGRIVRERFEGWDVGMLTSNPTMAAATGLPFEAPIPLRSGGKPVQLYRAVAGTY